MPVVGPITLVPVIRSGSEVNKTTRDNVCTGVGKDRCQVGKQSSQAGGFTYLSSVAVDQRTGDVYVTDNSNNRVQELSATGIFVLMFGWDVNETEDRRPGASQAEKNVCTAVSGDACIAGSQGTTAEQLAYPSSVAVEQSTGDLYVAEISQGDFRVDKYTPDGHFLWTIGKQVNANTRADSCSESEIERAHVRCKAGAENPSESLEPAAFKFAPTYGDILAVGRPEELLYVGDEHRVQEFEADGKWKHEILLASLSVQPDSFVVAMALDSKGDLYLVYRIPLPGGEEQANVIHEFNTADEEIAELAIQPKRPNATMDIDGMAVDATGRLAVIGTEELGNQPVRFGLLYANALVGSVTQFAGPSDNDGISFNAGGDLYVAATDDQEVIVYAPAPVVELVTSPIMCEIASPSNPSIAFDCALDA